MLDISACIAPVEDNSEFHPAFSSLSIVPVNHYQSLIQEDSQLAGGLSNALGAASILGNETTEDEDDDDEDEDDFEYGDEVEEDAEEDGELPEGDATLIRPMTLHWSLHCHANSEPVLAEEEQGVQDVEAESSTSQDDTSDHIIEGISSSLRLGRGALLNRLEGMVAQNMSGAQPAFSAGELHSTMRS